MERVYQFTPLIVPHWQVLKIIWICGWTCIGMPASIPQFIQSLEMTISNDAGVLGRVCTIVGDLGANISDMEFLDRKPDFFKLILTVDYEMLSTYMRSYQG